jgi:GNAT superfamily N-acetyltransferase
MDRTMNRTDNPVCRASESLTLRRATLDDAVTLIELIAALAHFEQLTPPAAEEQKRLVEDGFGERPRFEAWLAFWEDEPKPVGYAIFFATYSTFRACPKLYLEDLFVLPAYRQRGIGSALLRHCIQLAYERGCAPMEWTCLDWNTKAQAVYERIGARRLSEWHLYRLTRDGMEKFLTDSAKLTPGP